MTGISYFLAVRINASSDRRAASLGAPASSIRFFHPVQMPVRTMLMPAFFMAEKSSSQR